MIGFHLEGAIPEGRLAATVMDRRRVVQEIGFAEGNKHTVLSGGLWRCLGDPSVQLL